MTANPASFPGHILLAVTGLSPQVVTETLYALAAVEMPGFTPTEIHLLTTTTGKGLACTALLPLHPDGGRFHALQADYPQLGQPAFDDTRIHLIRASDGTLLPDTRSPEKNAATTDAITTLATELVRDDTAALHDVRLPAGVKR